MSIRLHEKKGQAPRVSPSGRLVQTHVTGLIVFTVCVGFIAGCTAPYYRKSADKEVAKILQAKQKVVFGQTNAFNIETRYSNRKPDDIPAKEIIQDRLESAKQVLSLPEALRIAILTNRQYQLNKENLYLTALDLAGARFSFRPRFSSNPTAVAGGVYADGKAELTQASVSANATTLLTTGGSITLNLFNNLMRFYTGDPSQPPISTLSAAIQHDLLRGSGKVARESLTQAERNVIYEIRTFSHFHNSFALSVVSAYFDLLQQQDTVRNQYNNYLSLVRFRERQEDLAKDRLPPFQVDQTRQDELRARNSYILAIERYQSLLDQFKYRTLGLPLGHEIKLDENALKEMEAVGLIPVAMSETEAFQMSLDHRLDLLNEMDRFEDRKRQIMVAADSFRPRLRLSADATLRTDYSRFNARDYQVGGGVLLDLPIDKLIERNNYREVLINFERQIRTLANFLDVTKDSVRAGLRRLDQARQSYEIQKSARDLADRRVENSELLLQAGRAQTRDVLDAQTARVQAYNAVTAGLINYHLTRLQLLQDMGVLKADEEKFWLKEGMISTMPPGAAQPKATALTDEVITPEKLFEK